MLNLFPIAIDLNPHTLAEVFYNGRSRVRLRVIRLLVTRSCKLLLMERVESICSQIIYHHNDYAKRGVSLMVSSFKGNRNQNSTIMLIP